MKKSNIGAIALLALVAVVYSTNKTSTRGDQANEAAPAVNRSSECDPNYSGCVPIASDVDCAGGPGNGPAYATGPIRVIGTDIYKMDGDGDGIACE